MTKAESRPDGGVVHVAEENLRCEAIIEVTKRQYIQGFSTKDSAQCSKKHTATLQKQGSDEQAHLCKVHTRLAVQGFLSETLHVYPSADRANVVKYRMQIPYKGLWTVVGK